MFHSGREKYSRRGSFRFIGANGCPTAETFGSTFFRNGCSPELPSPEEIRNSARSRRGFAGNVSSPHGVDMSPPAPRKVGQRTPLDGPLAESAKLELPLPRPDPGRPGARRTTQPTAATRENRTRRQHPESTFKTGGADESPVVNTLTRLETQRRRDWPIPESDNPDSSQTIRRRPQPVGTKRIRFRAKRESRLRKVRAAPAASDTASSPRPRRGLRGIPATGMPRRDTPDSRACRSGDRIDSAVTNGRGLPRRLPPT